jgi:glycosyltransferase involved in cell wall biosynthesis
MLAEGRGLIFFDLTQLVRRVTLSTPDGIGRVELGYAQHLLDKYPDQVRFIFASKRLVQIVPQKVAIHYIRQIDLAWKLEDCESHELTDKIAAFLHINRATFRDEASPGQSRRNRRLFMVANLLMALALQSVRPRNLAKYSASASQNAYINVSNSRISSNWLTRWLARSPSVSCIILIHDVIPITNPEFTLPQAAARHLRYVKRVAEIADIIIANSAYTYDCLKKHALKANLALPHVEVALLGVHEEFVGCRPPAKLKTPYFVFISTIEPRKNHTMLLLVWQRLVAKLGAAAPKLILIGRRGWQKGDGHPFVGPLLLDLLERSEALREHVLECSNVPDRLLIKLLEGACAALFPSHVEGFGLPLAEALSLGVPVICSDLPPFREIAGDIPEYIDPLAGRGWIRVITEYSMPDSPKRSAQIDRMQAFIPTRMSDHLAVLDSLMARAGVVDRPPGGSARGQGGDGANVELRVSALQRVGRLIPASQPEVSMPRAVCNDEVGRWFVSRNL